MAGRLIAHTGASYIDREGLKLLETPYGQIIHAASQC